jgi:hypothetical protein
LAGDFPAMNDDGTQRKLFTAVDLIEAQLLEGLLIVEGIEAYVRNECLQAGIGELPFVEMWPEVWVVHAADFQRAQEVLAVFVKRDLGAEWVCPVCREHNPGTFESCWSCLTGPTGAENEFRA